MSSLQKLLATWKTFAYPYLTLSQWIEPGYLHVCLCEHVTGRSPAIELNISASWRLPSVMFQLVPLATGVPQIYWCSFKWIRHSVKRLVMKLDSQLCWTWLSELRAQKLNCSWYSHLILWQKKQRQKNKENFPKSLKLFTISCFSLWICGICDFSWRCFLAEALIGHRQWNSDILIIYNNPNKQSLSKNTSSLVLLSHSLVRSQSTPIGSCSEAILISEAKSAQGAAHQPPSVSVRS